MVALEMIKDAQKKLEGVAVKTPLVSAPALCPSTKDFYLKAENLQLTGSFKLRGGFYKISQLSEDERKRGVIACSAGNHAQGVALAAQRNGIKATICIPNGAPLAKIEATRSYGADVVLCPGVYDDAYNKALELQKEFGYTFVHPFDDPYVIAGQGTIGLEILDQLPDVDVVLVPVGGGGLVSGITSAIKQVRPECKVYGVEAAGAASMAYSLVDNKPLALSSVNTIADGIAVKKPGDLTFDICSKYVDGILTVTDSEIASAMLSLMEKHKLVSEGSGAAAIAAAAFNKLDLTGKKVVAVLSGGNVDVTMLSRIITRGLTKTGRIVNFTLEIPDRPGQLVSALSIISGVGANIVSVTHNREHADLDIGSCYVEFVLETKNSEHIQELFLALSQAGYTIKK